MDKIEVTKNTVVVWANGEVVTVYLDKTSPHIVAVNGRFKTTRTIARRERS